jgi:hypothetical protein
MLSWRETVRREGVCMHAALVGCSVTLLFVLSSCDSSASTAGTGGSGGAQAGSDAAGGGGVGGSGGGQGGRGGRGGAGAEADGGSGGAYSGGDSAGQGGKGGSGGGSAGQGGKGGSGAAAGGGGGGAGSGDVAYDACIERAGAAGQDVDDCTRCLCQADNCQVQLAAATDDPKSNAVVVCGQDNGCTDQCCLCGDTCSFNGSNYGKGPCAAEIKTAAGVSPSSGLESAPTVLEKCDRNVSPDNSCRKIAVLAKCALDKCASACPVASSCP